MYFRFSSKCCWLPVAALSLPILTALRPPADDNPVLQIIKSLAGFYSTALPEKAYLHLDRALYASGEAVWYKAYVLEADSHRPDTLSKVLYVDLLTAQQRVVTRQTLRLRAGLAQGSLRLPDTLAAGTYQLRAYTNWMRNAGPDFFFVRPLVVGQARSQPQPSAPVMDLQFFPEGGNLIAGVESEVGFKAVDASGHGTDVQGTIFDGRNQPVATFGSRHLGMGSVRITPQAGQRYYALAKLPSGQQARYELPTSQATGYALHLDESADTFTATVRWTGAHSGTALLLAQVRGKAVAAIQIPLTGTGPVAVRVAKSKFPAGLAHFTLFDEQTVAQCERLAFIPNPPGVHLALRTDQATYGPRQAVHLQLQATNAAGQPVVGQFSVAVAAQTPADEHSPTIVSHLLLTSDLAGVVEDPAYYLQEPQTPEIRQATNDLLLTQGWRRFVWKELLAGQKPPQTFALEQGPTVAGEVSNAQGAPVVGAPVFYRQTTSTEQMQAQTQTDAAGRFLFRGLTGQDTAHVQLYLSATGKSPADLRLQLVPSPAMRQLVPPVLLPANAATSDYLRNSQQQAASQSIMLKNVTVKGAHTTRLDPATAYLSKSPFARVIPVGKLGERAANSGTILQYLMSRSISGLRIIDGRPNIRNAMSIRTGFREPLYIIDAVPVPFDIFADYLVAETESIEILTQTAAGLYGTQAYGGVIILHTRTTGLYDQAPQASFAMASKGAITLQIPGYYQAQEFYAPRYGAANSPTTPDPRLTTLHWAPQVQTNTNGQADIVFYTSDASGSFRASAEGIGADGLALAGQTQFTVHAISH